MKLTDALAAFNRKERYWLIRNALGPGAETLGADFRRRLGDAIGLTIPDDAWWAMALSHLRRPGARSPGSDLGSRRLGSGLPLSECFAAQGPKGAARDQMALDIEGVVDGGVSREEALS